MQKNLCVTLLLALYVTMLISLPATASAQENRVRIPNVTRWVRLFSQMEYDLCEAVRKRDKQAVSKLLTADFEMRTGSVPGNPIPRAVWMRQSLNEPKLQCNLEQMAVHDYNKMLIVSFLWTVTPDAQPGAERQVFIVDTWQQQAGAWKLAVRYAAPGGKSKIAIPAGIPPTPLFEKKE